MEHKQFVISLIRHKRELASISDDFIKPILDEYIEKNQALWSKIINHPKIEKSRELKILVKDIRKRLRDVYGAFSINLNKRNKLLGELGSLVNSNAEHEKIVELHKKILMTHRSTKERLNHYSEIYGKIFSITGKPKHILDLAAGLNPLSLIFTDLKDIKCTAVELTDEDCSFLNHYFKIMKIDGTTLKMNLLVENKFPKADICFMFKLLDSLETMRKNISKDLISSIDAKFIVISFPTRTLSGKPLSAKRLGWFRKLVDIHEEFEVQNEIFFVVKK